MKKFIPFHTPTRVRKYVVKNVDGEIIAQTNTFEDAYKFKVFYGPCSIEGHFERAGSK